MTISAVNIDYVSNYSSSITTPSFAATANTLLVALVTSKRVMETIEGHGTWVSAGFFVSGSNRFEIWTCKIDGNPTTDSVTFTMSAGGNGSINLRISLHLALLFLLF